MNQATSVIPKELFQNAMFDWEDLNGKTLKIAVGGGEDYEGAVCVIGKCVETGKMYLLHSENNKGKA